MSNMVHKAGSLASNTLSQSGNIGSSTIGNVNAQLENEKQLVNDQLIRILQSQQKVQFVDNILSGSCSCFFLLLGIIMGYIVCRTMN